MNWCLIKEKSNELLKAMEREGGNNLENIIKMSTEERTNFFKKYVGDFNAKPLNIEFEAKLLLKNQQRGLINWIKNAAGLNEKSKIDIVDRINKLDKALNPATKKQFLSDIVERRLGVKIDIGEATIITNFTKTLKSLYDPKLEMWEQPKEYWQTKQKLVSYLREVTPETIVTTKWGVFKRGLSSALSIERAIKTGFDLSAPLRQGRTYMGTKEWNGALKRMFGYAKDKLNYDELEVAMMSNKYSEFAIKNKNKLGLTQLGETFTQREEQFGAKVIDKIPLLRGSERAFTGFLNDLRFNRFVNILEKLDKAGKGITDNPKAVSDLAEVIAAATGRGSLGSAEGAAKSLATVLFSPRWLVSRFEVLTNVITKSGPARVEAIKSIMSVAGTSVAILGMLKMAGADVELDPRSSDFGKAKIGNTRFDVTGGIAPVITLMARLTPGIGGIKSNTTGEITKLNQPGFFSQTGQDILINFFTSKTAPVASVVRDVWFRGQDFNGNRLEINPLSLKSDLNMLKYLTNQLVLPLLTTDAWQAFHDSSGGIIPGLISLPASMFGLGVNTYSSQTNWGQSTSAELKAFKDEVGDNQFKQANALFNQKVKEWLDSIKNDETFKSSSLEQKTNIIANSKEAIKAEILSDLGFHYTAPKKEKTPKLYPL